MAGMTGSSLMVETVRGTQVLPHLDAVAQLRIRVFGAWPYLYQGDAAYERDYLAAYAASPDSLFVLARDGDAVIGASPACRCSTTATRSTHRSVRQASILPACSISANRCCCRRIAGRGSVMHFSIGAKRMHARWAALH